MISFQENKRLIILIGAAIALLVLLVSLQAYRSFLGARLPIPALSDTVIGGRLNVPTLSVGNHTLEFRGKITDGQALNDTVTFNVVPILQAAAAHISYDASTSTSNVAGVGQLRYATNASGTWVTTVVDSGGATGVYNDLAVDSKGKVHISYMYNRLNGPRGLAYATNASGNWIATDIVEVDEKLINLRTSITIDNNDKPHISFNDRVSLPDGSSHHILKHATNISGNWVAETVDATRGVGGHNAIAVDSNNKLHISYSGNDGTNSLLKYATNGSGSWVTEVVEESFAAVGSSIKTDSQNKAHISYASFRDGDNWQLKYATNKSGNWATEDLPTIKSVGSSHSLVLDAQDKTHISYAEYRSSPFTNPQLKYVTNASGSWVASVVDDGEYVGDYNAIAIDRHGNLYISYRDEANRALKYATKILDNWVTSKVDSSAAGINSSSIGVAEPSSPSTPTPTPTPIAIPQFWQNPVNKFDVNNDGYVTAADRLALVNLQNTGSIESFKTTTAQAPYYDVNGDTEFSPADLLLITQCLDQGACN